MPFVPHLKNALLKRGGDVGPDNRSVIFKSGNDVIAFRGTGREMPNEEIRVEVNGKELSLERWLDRDTPLLKTGSKIVKNVFGNYSDCINICDRILIDLGFLSSGKNKMYGKRKIEPLFTTNSDNEDSERILPDRLKEIVVSIETLRKETIHKERSHEILVEDYLEILGYQKIKEIRYQYKNSDMCIFLNDNPIIVIEVKKDWKLSRDYQDVFIQAYRYAIDFGARFAVMTNGDYYAIYDRTKGLSRDDNFVGDFRLSNLTPDKMELVDFLSKENMISSLSD